MWKDSDNDCLTALNEVMLFFFSFFFSFFLEGEGRGEGVCFLRLLLMLLLLLAGVSREPRMKRGARREG